MPLVAASSLRWFHCDEVLSDPRTDGCKSHWLVEKVEGSRSEGSLDQVLFLSTAHREACKGGRGSPLVTGDSVGQNVVPTGAPAEHRARTLTRVTPDSRTHVLLSSSVQCLAPSTR